MRRAVGICPGLRLLQLQRRQEGSAGLPVQCISRAVAAWHSVIGRQPTKASAATVCRRSFKRKIRHM
ncbi:hypothetical protein PI125_g21122 [Phytophthora idaei]|nr:hypothetical protein PI125_g21122 [Phytophthora idaei]